MLENMHWWDAVGVFTGVVGLALAFWSHARERRVTKLLEDKQAELDRTLTTLKELSNYADGIKAYGIRVQQ